MQIYGLLFALKKHYGLDLYNPLKKIRISHSLEKYQVMFMIDSKIPFHFVEHHYMVGFSQSPVSIIQPILSQSK